MDDTELISWKREHKHKWTKAARDRIFVIHWGIDGYYWYEIDRATKLRVTHFHGEFKTAALAAGDCDNEHRPHFVQLELKL